MPTPTVYSCFRKSYTIDDKLNWLYFELEKLKEQGGGDYDEKIAELQRQIFDLRNSVTNLVTTTAYMAADIQTLQETTANHTSLIGALDRTTRNINNEVTAINAALASVDDDITRIDNELADHLTRLGTLTETVNRHSERLNGIDESIELLFDGNEEINNLISAMSETINSLQLSLNGLGRQLSATQQNVATLRTDVNDLTESLETALTTLDELGRSVREDRAELDRVGAQVRTNTDAITVLNGTIFEVQQTVDFEIPLMSEDIPNTSIPSIDINLTTEQAAIYKAVTIGKYEVKDAAGKRINCSPVAIWTQNQQSLIRIRLLACGTIRQRAKSISCTVFCSVR